MVHFMFNFKSFKLTYINFKKPSHATDSELTDKDIIIRYEGETIVGISILHTSKR